MSEPIQPFIVYKLPSQSIQLLFDIKILITVQLLLKMVKIEKTADLTPSVPLLNNSNHSVCFGCPIL